MTLTKAFLFAAAIVFGFLLFIAWAVGMIVLADNHPVLSMAAVTWSIVLMLTALIHVCSNSPRPW